MLLRYILKNLRGGLNELLKQAGSCKICIRKFLRRLGTVFALTRQAHRLPCQCFAHHSPHFAQQVHRTTLRFVRGFTLAEVLLVLVILGVIAAITMPTLNLSGNKEKALEVKAMKVLGDFDKALEMIIFNDSNGSLAHVYDPYGSGTTFGFHDLTKKAEIKATLAKYLKITNKQCTDSSCACAPPDMTSERYFSFYLNNGTCVRFIVGPVACEDCSIPGSGVCHSSVQTIDSIYIDVNNTDGPNQNGADQFRIPMKYSGIDYQCTECNVKYCEICAPGNANKCTKCYDYRWYNHQILKCNCTLNEEDGTCDCSGNKCTPVEEE